MKKKHGSIPDRRFFCEICDKKYSSKSALKFHGKSHFKTPVPKVPCLECGVLIESVKVEKHMSRFHRECICSKCGKVFKNKLILRNHDKSAHKPIRPGSCPICRKQFKTQSGLGRHLKQHQNEDLNEDNNGIVENEIEVEMECNFICHSSHEAGGIEEIVIEEQEVSELEEVGGIEDIVIEEQEVSEPEEVGEIVCEYEKNRDDNIREREELFRSLELGGVSLILDNNWKEKEISWKKEEK